MAEHDFKEWNKVFNKLRHKHDTWQIFSDWLDLTIDGFTIPGMKPLFQHPDKYSEQEYIYFSDMFRAYIQSMDKVLVDRPYFDFLGEWWESDQNMTNKFKAQFFTPMHVVDLMCQVTLSDDMSERPKVMSDCCCGSGRFGLAWHHYRPMDWFFLADLDDYAVKMTLINMCLHGMRGVVAHMNTLTYEVFGVWQVTPFDTGVPYIVPYGTDLMGAKTILPREVFEAPSVNTMNSDKTETTIDSMSTVESITKSNKKGGLDAWLY